MLPLGINNLCDISFYHTIHRAITNLCSCLNLSPKHNLRWSVWASFSKLWCGGLLTDLQAARGGSQAATYSLWSFESSVLQEGRGLCALCVLLVKQSSLVKALDCDFTKSGLIAEVGSAGFSEPISPTTVTRRSPTDGEGKGALDSQIFRTRGFYSMLFCCHISMGKC